MSMRTLEGHMWSVDGKEWVGSQEWLILPRRDREGRVFVSSWQRGGIEFRHYPTDPDSPYAEFEEECEWLEGHPCWVVANFLLESR